MRMFNLLMTAAMLTLSTGSLSAADFRAQELAQAYPYKNLPGVKAPQAPGDAVMGTDQNCSSEVGTRRRHGSLSSTESVLVYRCSHNGVEAESFEPPYGPQGPFYRPDSGYPWGR